MIKPLILSAAVLFAGTAAAQQKPQPPIPWDAMDLGPFHSGCFKIDNRVTAKGVAVRAGSGEEKATFLFDTELLRVSAVWTGDHVRFPRGRGGLEGQIGAGGPLVFTNEQVPGWAAGEIGDDPRAHHQGNLPAEQGKWRGLHLNGDRVALSYDIAGASVLESPGYAVRGGVQIFTRSFTVTRSEKPFTILIADVPGGVGTADVMTLEVAKPGDGSVTSVAFIDSPAGSKLEVTGKGRIVARIPPLRDGVNNFQISLTVNPKASAPAIAVVAEGKAPDLREITRPVGQRWPQILETKGKLGTGDGAYLADEIALPDENPWKSWLRLAGHDFFPDGTAAVANISGDVWLVAGLDDTLEHVKWKRFASGLFQPLGLKIVNGTIYVTGRDQITRLIDVNRDGEADHYENFNNDCVVTENYHEFALDLQTDSKGNFYYAKGAPWTPEVQSPHQGTLLRVPKNGSKLEIVATGFRAPNGMAIGPRDEITVSDNQGHWMPANRLNLVKPGGFYGLVTAAHRKLTFTGADGVEYQANPSDRDDRAKTKESFWGKNNSPIPKEGMEPPLVWMPQSVDNSPGGEVWATSGKFGPWDDHLLHLSYGHCVLYGVLPETVGEKTQAAIYKFPFKFASGIMRGRFSPRDGQLYMTGLNVWQTDGAKLGCFSRVRYTGKKQPQPIAWKTNPKGMSFTFSAPLDAETAGDPGSYSLERWNYKWTGNYGSPDFKASDPAAQGKDAVNITAAKLSPDKKTLTLELDSMTPAMTYRLKYKIRSAEGATLDHEYHATVHEVGK